MTRFVAAISLTTLGLALGCGDVFADLDVRKSVPVDPSFEPGAVYAGNVTWLGVRARFEGSIALIEEHDLDGSKSIKLAYDRLDFFPGACPDVAVSETEAGGSGASSTDTQSEDGSWLFCAAVEVGPFETTTVVPIRIVFWNGTERLTGTAELTVNASGTD